MGKVIKLADHNGYSSSRSVQDALDQAGKIAEERDLNSVHIILLDNKGDEYDLTQISAGIDRYTDAIALLDIAKSENKREMGF